MKSVVKTSATSRPKPKSDKIYGVYIDSLLTKKIVLSITEIGKNIKENLQRKLATSMEGKCIEEGFIRPRSIHIVNYSSGQIDRDYVTFQTVFACKICHPVEGMLVECTVKTITKAGIHAEVLDGETIPVTVFVARDHHTMDKHFQHVKENARILVKIIGSRYELNDPYICVIGKLVQSGDHQEKKKPIKILGGMENYMEGGDDEDGDDEDGDDDCGNDDCDD